MLAIRNQVDEVIDKAVAAELDTTDLHIEADQLFAQVGAAAEAIDALIEANREALAPVAPAPKPAEAKPEAAAPITLWPGGAASAAATIAAAMLPAGLIRHARGSSGPSARSSTPAACSAGRRCARCPPIRPGRTSTSDGQPWVRSPASAWPLVRL